jgi:class I fructose-bisphosphate aldolase
MSISARLNRLFDPASGRCIDVAMDHGFFGEHPHLAGIEDMTAAVDAVAAAGPDAVQLSPGQAPLLAARPRSPRIALVLRADVANVYSPEPPSEPFDLLIDDAIGLAVRHDAACVCLNLFDIPGQGRLRGQCVDNIARARTAAERAGMPVMVEPLPMNPGVGGYETDGDADRLVALVRQATELGADVIKVDVTDDLDQYGRVVEAARVPVLARGGGRIDDTELFERTHAVLAQGAAGVVYGRNVIQHEDPAAMVRALRALVHEGLGVDEARAELGVAAG